MSNYGSSYTGYTRIAGTINLLNPLRHGDVLSLSGLSSGSDLTNYARIGYDLLLNGQGTHIGAAYSDLHYVLGGSLSSLDGHGSASVSSAWVRQPIVRSRDVTVYGQLDFDYLQLRDRYDLGDIQIDRHLENWTASLSGDFRDGLLSGGVSSLESSLAGGTAELRRPDGAVDR